MMGKLKNKINKWFAAGLMTMALFLVFSFFPVSVEAAEPAEPDVVIKDFKDLMIFAAASQGIDFEGQTIVLANDIEISRIEQSVLDKYGIKHLTIGKKGMPFKGTFDGQGHTIKGLTYADEIVKDANSGLFSFIENATIQNLIVEDADLHCIFQGGVIVGYATNSTLKDITVLNSTLHITSANNVVSLVTNGGFSGGGIAGIIENSLMYNCEVSGTNIFNNATAGVTGVGGEGLYMGGLVGWASGSDIEYCRARANYKGEGDSRELRNTTVRNDYYIAVGALGGKSVYAGGIVGGVNNGCFITDCFSTAKVSFDVANYVAVGSGIAGYAGGITGALRGNSMISRCHYAGDISSKQYNAVLVIPIIQYNVNINGIARIREDGSVVMNSYFKPSAITSGASISAIGGENDTVWFGPKDDNTYIDIEFWESREFDFMGVKDRKTTKYPDTHYNKWVMDYDLGIPVHGNSVMATFDFPGAGKVSIDKTALVQKAVETDDPQSFAIQGVHPREVQEVTLNAALNENYRLSGWFKKSAYDKHEASDIKELLDITQDTSLKIDEGQTPFKVPIKDRDLFVAGIEANVTFHQVDGTVIQECWHKYDSNLEDVKPSPVGQSIFYGWTTIPNTLENGQPGGYSSITSTELNNIKQQGELYQAGDLVKKEMQLYPIFIDSSANVITEFEGHEQDGTDDITKRDGVGYTSVEIGDANNDVYINVFAEDAATTFPTGYQFRGWYKKISDTEEVCVSREYRYKVPDISEKVIYVARFTYAVDYYARAYHEGDGSGLDESKLFTTIQYNYKESFQSINGPAYCMEKIVGWGNNHQEHGGEECTDGYNDETLIVNPMIVYSHNYCYGDATEKDYTVTMTTDFPNSGEINNLGSSEGATNYKFRFTPKQDEKGKDRYHLQFWTLERAEILGRDDAWTYSNNPMETGQVFMTEWYKGCAMVSADVNFHNNDGILKKVQRRYNDAIFLTNDSVYDYVYPICGEPVDTTTVEEQTISGTLTREAAPSDVSMKKDGYQFLGWINKAELSDSEWNYLYDVPGETYCTSDIAKAEPFILKAYTDENHSGYLEDRLLVKETMDLYPVYAKYDITTTTNIHEMGNLPADINLPGVPTYELVVNDAGGSVSITVTAESDKTNVLANIGEDKNPKKYKLLSMYCEVDGKTQKLDIKADGSGNYVYQGEVIPGKSYKFIAVYSPVIVSYHMNDNSDIEPVVKDIGERLGISPKPDFANIAGVADSYFAGWTETQPEGASVWKFANEAEFNAANIQLLSSEYIVKKSIHLWPVFVKPGITVNSNIDTVITDAGKNPQDYRTLMRNAEGDLQLTAKDYTGYVFHGWYEGYQNEDNQGTKVSDAAVVKLPPEELFSSKTYTAVFKQACTVRYHDIAGNVIYTVNVESGTRSFVEEIKNEQGQTTGEIAIDTEAILKLHDTLGANDRFNEWQWKSDTMMIPWKDFKNKPIESDMDIYPDLVSVSTYDADDIKCDGVLEYFVTSENDAPLLTGLFQKPYSQPKLTIQIVQKVWNPENNASQEIAIEQLPTRVYSENIAEDGNIKYVEASQGPILTDGLGKALHEFFGKLILKKNYEDKSVNSIIYFEITDNSSQQTRTVPLEVQNGAGTQTVNLPIGDYTINEITDWSWRDEVGTIHGVDGQNRFNLQIGNEKEILVTNRRTNEKWFADESRTKNVYK